MRWIWVPVAALVAMAITVAVIGGTLGRDDTPALVRADPGGTYDPVKAGEPTPDGFWQVLGRDRIAPVYEPAFTSADNVDWPQDTLVVGVSGKSESKAYPVTHLNQREMVIDYIDGEPILVSW